MEAARAEGGRTYAPPAVYVSVAVVAGMYLLWSYFPSIFVPVLLSLSAVGLMATLFYVYVRANREDDDDEEQIRQMATAAHSNRRRLFIRLGSAAAAMHSQAQPTMVNPLNLRLTLLNRDFGAADYEALLALDNVARQVDALRGVAAVGGADERQLSQLPVHEFREAAKEQTGEGEGQQQPPQSCAICLESFVGGDSIKTLPCLHQFHAACVDRWLSQKAVCPVCKHHLFR